MPNPKTAEEWAEKCHLDYQMGMNVEGKSWGHLRHGLCEHCANLFADAYTRQQVEVLEAEIRRLREECGRRGGMSNPHLEAISWCCDEHRQKSANEWIAHRAVVRELALSLETFVVGHFMDYGHAADVLAHPLVQQAREGRDA